MVVAKTRQAAMDATELVDAAYDTDDSLALTIKDLNGPLVWPDSPDNIAALHHVGDKQAVMRRWTAPRPWCDLILMCQKSRLALLKCAVRLGR